MGTEDTSDKVGLLGAGSTDTGSTHVVDIKSGRSVTNGRNKSKWGNLFGRHSHGHGYNQIGHSHGEVDACENGDDEPVAIPMEPVLQTAGTSALAAFGADGV
jgi:hypothetical protein